MDRFDLGHDAEVALAVALGADHADRRLVDEVRIGAELARDPDGLGRAARMAVDLDGLRICHGVASDLGGLHSAKHGLRVARMERPSASATFNL